MLKQRTLKDSFTIKGVGLHTGRKCHARFQPGADNTGIVFVRTDLPNKPAIPAHVDSVVDVIRGTTLGREDIRIYTIEHILSALHGMRIDNAVIELDDNEPPVLDGSSIEFVRGIEEVGIVEQSAQRNFFMITTPFDYAMNNTFIRIEPCDHFE